jgi:TatD DNase family protein
MSLHGSDHAAPSVESAQSLAAAVGVTRIVQVGCDRYGAAWAAETAERHEGIVAAVGLHPNEAPRLAAAGQLDAGLAEIEALLGRERVRGVGETGLDYYRTGPEGRAVQEESFRAHIRLAMKYDKALVIHDRDAHDDVIAVLEDEGPPRRVVFHCFSGDAEMARRCAGNGWVLSFAGVLTFRNAPGLREAAAAVGPGSVLVETDAPYLTPVPHRGRPNASYLVPLTVAELARIWGMSDLDVCAATTEAALTVFGDWEPYHQAKSV